MTNSTLCWTSRSDNICNILHIAVKVVFLSNDITLAELWPTIFNGIFIYSLQSCNAVQWNIVRKKNNTKEEWRKKEIAGPGIPQ